MTSDVGRAEHAELVTTNQVAANGLLRTTATLHRLEKSNSGSGARKPHLPRPRGEKERERRASEQTVAPSL